MKIIVAPRFVRQLKKMANKKVLIKINELLDQIERIENLDEVPHLKKMSGYPGFYRIRLGDYRIGIYLNGDTVTFVDVDLRKNIYRRFPPK